VTWSYWLRNVKELDFSQDRIGERNPKPQRQSKFMHEQAEDVEDVEVGIKTDKRRTLKTPPKLPCRISITLEGAEWFVYNRSAAYDLIIAGMMQEDGEPEHNSDDATGQTDAKSRVRHRGVVSKSAESSSKGTSVAEDDAPAGNGRASRFTHTEKSNDRKSSTTRTADSETSCESAATGKLPILLKFLPIHIECKRAAVVLGNENTKSVLITKIESATGEIDAERSGPLDLYKQLYNFQFQHPVVQMKPNDDYKEDQATAAVRIKRGISNQTEKQERHIHTHSFFHRQRRKTWHRLQDMVPALRRSVESFSSNESGQPGDNPQVSPRTSSWQGLSRYLDESEVDDKARWSSIEYATVTTIVDCPEAKMSFYWDAVGNVPQRSREESSHKDAIKNINGDLPPEWGINLSLKSATINYGPWADRQRADLQKVFFPSLCKDAVPGKKLSSGQPRVPTQFKLFIELDDESTLRVPIREESKNWKWARQADTINPRQTTQKRNANKNRKRMPDKGNAGPEIRPFGWLDIKVGANSTVKYEMDMIADSSGFSNTLELDLPGIEITTSVNHGLLLRSVKNSIICDLSNPLQWNGHHVWKFDIKANDLELFILREHVFLLIDLVDDWASGPLPEFLTFSPFKYLVNLHLGDFKLYLNINDANIINNPSDFDDNTFIIIFGSLLDANICIPLDKYRPHRTDISFKVDAKQGGLNLHVPPWNTQATFMNSPEIATLKTLAIQGKYQYCATTSPTNTDTLLLNVHGDRPTAQFYGFVIRYYLKVKDNYFGEDIRFKTLEEYQEVLRAQRGEITEVIPAQPHKKSNDLDVILSVSADNTNVILPANLYTAKNHIRIEIARLEADLRFTNYYMDLEVVLSTLALSQGNDEDGTATPISATSSTQVFVDGVNVTGNRLFGLPPTEPTYVCNWDFAVGAIVGECTTSFFSHLVNGVKALAFSFDDDENALPPISELVLHDVTFLRASIESVRLWLHVEDAVFFVSTGKLTINFNDWAGSHYSGKSNVQIPNLQLACVDAESASRHRSRSQYPVETHALFETTVSLSIIQRKLGFLEDRKLQQEHIRNHDQRTHRADFLLRNEYIDDSMLAAVDPPAMCVPPMPPIARKEDDFRNLDEGSTISSKGSSPYRKRHLVRKSSFLSLSSSTHRSNGSIAGGHVSYTGGEGIRSGSRSRNLHAVIGQSTQMRDVSASTGGRKSSFYSAVGEHKGLPPSTVTFSSSYLAPYFPLEGVEPDKKHLPSIISNGHNSTFNENQPGLEDIDISGMDDKATHMSFILELPTGIRGVLNAKTVSAVIDLISALQPVQPQDILDSLQIQAVNQVFDLNKQKIKTGTVLDFTFQTPSINLRFLNSAATGSSNSSSHTVYDQYDSSLSGLSLTLRSKTIAMETVVAEGGRDSSALHFSLRSANISAKERLNILDDAQAAVNAGVEDIVFWAASNDEISSSIVLKSLELITASSKVEYFASLVHRTTVLASTLGESFSSRNRQQKDRLQLFVYLVAVLGQNATDPLFLTRPSYVLRSARDHLRTTDSWKVATRFHHMYDSLDAMTKGDITMRCIENTEVIPEDSKAQVRVSFSRWRGWDLQNIDSSLLLGRVYESLKKNPKAAGGLRPLRVSFRTELVQLVLDPGPKQNEISLAALIATAETKRAGVNMQSTVVEIFSEDVSIQLNWELCELANNILRLYQQTDSPSSPPEIRSTAVAHHTASKIKHTLQVICATEKGSISLDTINIRSVSISKGLKTSFIMMDDETGESGLMMSLMIAAEAATTRIKSHSQELTLCQLRNPSVYACSEIQFLDGTPSKDFKLAAKCKELSFDVRQDILGLIGVLDLIIGDEIGQVFQLVKSVPSNRSPNNKAQSPIPQARLSSSSRVHIALFLDMYHISVPLLQSIVYNISGVVARASVAAQLDSEVVFNFDVKEHAHDIQTINDNRTQSISLLQMPPTNGRITAHISDDEHSVSIFASVEPVKLDAAAIHSLLTAINRPEISNVVAEIQEDMKGVQIHIEDIFGQPKKSPASTPRSEGKPFIYDIHLTLAGFDVYTNAKGAEKDHRTRLDLNLGCVQLVVSNRLEQYGPVLEFPELRVGLHQIMFELARSKNGSNEPCGNLSFAAFLTATSKSNDLGDIVRSFHVKSDELEINLCAETASSVVDIIGHLQHKIKDLDLSREKTYFRKLRKSKPRIAINNEDPTPTESMHGSSIIFGSMYSLELLNIQVSWLIGKHIINHPSGLEPEDLVLSFKRIDLSTKKENSARLTIEELQLQLVPISHDKKIRSLNSALLPEVIFNVGYVSTTDARRLAFQAAGKSLDLRLTSQFIIPAVELQKSIGGAADKVRAASASWIVPTTSLPIQTPRRKPFFGNKRMESLLVDADFAGAVVYLSGKKVGVSSPNIGSRSPQVGKYGQFKQSDATSSTVLQAPGLAWKVEYKDSGIDEPSLNAEVKVDASSNTLFPAVVPLIMEIMSAVKDMVSDEDQGQKDLQSKAPPQKFMIADEDNILTADPSAVLGKTRLNLGLRICKQEFSLSCQPIARVAATARFDDIYLAVNTVRSTEHGHFFAISAVISKLQASVQHVYSRESTGSFDVDSVFLSLMNSKHVSGTSGVSAILKISPMRVLVNAKQLQDFLLFREIWVPVEIRQNQPTPSSAASAAQSQKFLVQRYQKVAATGAFPWNATVSIAELDVQLDLGQALGRSSFMISNFWISSKKNSDWEQNLCLGFDKVGVDSTGRMSGFVELQNFKIRTSIHWPAREMALNQTPLIQGSLGFSQLRIKAAFDYQAFLVADITSFEFMMYNVRNGENGRGDRLVAILDGESVQVFCTTTTASQALALYQAFLRLVHEKRTNYEASLVEIEKFMKRKSVAQPAPSTQPKNSFQEAEERLPKSPISLHTDVIVTLKAVNMGAFPNTFSDHQVFKLEALDAQARFAVTMDHGKIHSILGLTLGQLRIGLAGVKRIDMPKSVGEISVEDVVSRATGSRGGTILKVPKVEATMQTWQVPDSNHIDYIFKSSFEGKVEVGWNYSRISYIRSMWASHSKALAQRLGKPLPPSAVKITGVPDEANGEPKEGEQQKITAEVNVPQSKYDYTALEAPIIETPQLRDMGEAVSKTAHDAFTYKMFD